MSSSSFDETIKQLIDEINKVNEGEQKENSNEFIKQKENEILKKFDQIKNSKTFFTLPLNIILSIVSKYDFSDYDDDCFEFIKFIVEKTIEQHSDEREIQFLINSLHNIDGILDFSEIVEILSLIPNCDLFKQLHKSYEENEKSPEIDYEYELSQKDKKIEELQKLLTLQYPQFSSRPENFIPDIFDACSKGHLPSIQYLIENEGIDKNISQDGIKLIHVASGKGFLEIVQYLILKAGVDPETCDNTQMTPLHYACDNAHIEVIKFLIEIVHANKEAEDDLNHTPLILSCQKGKLEVVQYLIEEAHVDIQKYSNIGKTPLHRACDNGHLPIVQYLIERVGFNSNGNEGQNFSPIECGCIWGHLPIVQYLIEKCKVDPNQKNNKGESPLFTAISRNKFNIVQYLIEKVKVNIDITNNSGENALHKYIEYASSIEMIQYFIEKIEIDINIQDSKGNTLLHVAYDNYRNEIAEYLISRGIDQTLKNKSEQLAISLKKERNNDDYNHGMKRGKMKINKCKKSTKCKKSKQNKDVKKADKKHCDDYECEESDDENHGMKSRVMHRNVVKCRKIKKENKKQARKPIHCDSDSYSDYESDESLQFEQDSEDN